MRNNRAASRKQAARARNQNRKSRVKSQDAREKTEAYLPPNIEWGCTRESQEHSPPSKVSVVYVCETIEALGPSSTLKQNLSNNSNSQGSQHRL